MARKDYRPWTMGPLELAVESMRFHSVKGRKGSENVTISQLEGYFAIQAQGSFTIHFLMAIRAVQDPHGLFAIQNAIPKIDLQDPGLELVCSDIKLFRDNLPQRLIGDSHEFNFFFKISNFFTHTF
jgi:hypothetical protein